MCLFGEEAAHLHRSMELRRPDMALVEDVFHDLDQHGGLAGVDRGQSIGFEQHACQRVGRRLVDLTDAHDIPESRSVDFPVGATRACGLQRSPAHRCEGIRNVGRVARQRLIEHVTHFLGQIRRRKALFCALDLDEARRELDAVRVNPSNVRSREARRGASRAIKPQRDLTRAPRGDDRITRSRYGYQLGMSAAMRALADRRRVLMVRVLVVDVGRHVAVLGTSLNLPLILRITTDGTSSRELTSLPEAFVLNALGAVGGITFASLQVGGVIGVVALEEYHLAVAFEGQDMRGDTIQEPAVM